VASPKARVSLIVLIAATLSRGASASAEQPDDDPLNLLNRAVAQYTHANAIILRQRSSL
jgi:hypothetical protein